MGPGGCGVCARRGRGGHGCASWDARRPKRIEGRAGWAPAFFGDGDAALLAKVVGDDAFGLDHVSVKAFPVSGIAQVPTALASLMGKRFDSRPPERLEIRVPARELNYPAQATGAPSSHGRIR